MRITFGMSLDGAEWSGKPASLGEIKMGPQQFLDWLESRLGLSGIPVSAPERIDEYRRKIERVNPQWCRVSFELDPWSTARQLLAWRDELVENGWDFRRAGTPRLEALAALEADSGTLSPGVPDRMLAVWSELPHHRFDGDTLRLAEPRELLPYLWRQLILRLEGCGMAVFAAGTGNSCCPKPFPVEGANDFVLAAECVRYLRARGENSSVAIICTGDSTVLDEVLHRNGFGRLAFSENSRWRETLQILPLWLESMWKPFHPQRFLELLLLPVTPVPAALARELVAALEREPGRGGEAWQEAWRRIRSKFQTGDSGFKAVEEMWKFLEEECFRAEESVPSGTVVRFCSLLIERIAPRVRTRPELAPVLEQAGILKRIIADRAAVSRTELARILDSIVGTGTPDGGAERECNDFAVFPDPGMIDREFETVIWWNFIDRTAVGGATWTPEECAAMPGFSRETAREREHLAWRNAFRCARRNLILFIPRMLRGEAVFPHPLLDELEVPGGPVRAPAGLVDASGRWKLADRASQLEEQPFFVPTVRPRIDGNAISPVRMLSYTQLDTLLACPFRWFLQDYAGLGTSPVMRIPTDGLMLGNLAHKVVETIYRGRESIETAEAAQVAAREFDRLVPAMAAELLLDGRTLERKRIRETLIAAVEALVREINSRHLLVKGAEKELRGTFAGMEFQGKLDLYLEDAAGKQFVIDMKWSASSRYQESLENGKALQLAAYSRLLDAEEFDVHCGYFLLPKRKLLYEPNPQWGELWEKAETMWKQRLEKIHAGILERGEEDERKLKHSPLTLPLAAGCGFCDYAALCAQMEEQR